MSERQTALALELKHTAMSEEEALRFLDGHRISRGGRTMSSAVLDRIVNRSGSARLA